MEIFSRRAVINLDLKNKQVKLISISSHHISGPKAISRRCSGNYSYHCDTARISKYDRGMFT